MALGDELRAAQSVKYTKCAVCRWLQTLPDGDAAEWDTYLADIHSFGNAAVLDVMRKRNIQLTDGQLKNHRSSGHRATQ